MAGLRSNIAILSALLLSLVDLSASVLPECSKLKEDFPDGLYDYSRSLREDLKVLGMALDDLFPFGHPYEVETVIEKARELPTLDNWNQVSPHPLILPYLLGRPASDEGKENHGPLKDRPLIGAIMLFYSLRECLYKCQFSSSLALAANYVAAFENELYATDGDRVKWAILQVLAVHREKCLPSYLDHLRSQISTLESDEIRQLNIIFDSDLLSKVLRGKDIKDVSSAEINDQLLQERSALYDRVAVLAKDTEEAKYISAKRSDVKRYDYEVRPEFKSKTIAKYIMEPCRKFVRKFRDIFHPMRVDFVLMNGSSIGEAGAETVPPENDPTQNAEFINFWTKYRLCSELYNDRARFADLITSEVPYKLGLIVPEVETTTTQAS